MATRFYLPSSGSVSISPAFSTSGFWEQTGEADRMPLVLERLASVATTLTNKTVTVPITTTQDILCRQFISDPLDAQVVSGVFKIVIRCSEDATTTNANFSYSFWVSSNDGTVSRGNAANGRVVAEFALNGSDATIAFSSSMSNTSAQKGDRLIIEFGVNGLTPTSAGTATERFGNSASSDFAFNNNLTTDLNPWIEFNQDFIFLKTSLGNYDPYVKVGSGQSRNERAT